MTLFAAEVKTGMAGGNEGLQQVAKAQAREVPGKLFFDQRLWDNLPPPPTYTTHRVIVAPTVATAGTRAKADFHGQVTYDSLLLEREWLRDIAELLLRAGGKLP